MNIAPDQIVLFHIGAFAVNATVVFSWVVVTVLVSLSCFLARNVSNGMKMRPGQNLMEVILSGIERRAGEMTREDSRRYIPFIGTFFLFILTSNVLDIVPGFEPPTGSFSTTAALTACVLFAAPYYGAREQGLGRYLARYVRPTVLMLPFNLLGELSRTIALTVRLVGNIMSAALAGAILIAVVPLVFPVFTRSLGLLFGVIQAYIYSVLALAFISSASRAHASEG